MRSRGVVDPSSCRPAKAGYYELTLSATSGNSPHARLGCSFDSSGDDATHEQLARDSSVDNSLTSLSSFAQELAPIERLLPPPGFEISAEQRQRLATRLDQLRGRLEALEAPAAVSADIKIYLKAVDYALLHGEFYKDTDVAVADRALDSAEARIEQVRAGDRPWTRQRGLVVRGYQSPIDDSVQPYGLVIPPDHQFEHRVPLYVWLHGRGDKSTDLHVIHERETKQGRIAASGGAVDGEGSRA